MYSLVGEPLAKRIAGDLQLARIARAAMVKQITESLRKVMIRQRTKDDLKQICDRYLS